MVGVVQWLERQIVALEVVGSTPITHPIFLLGAAFGGVSPSGKAPDFDSGIRRFDPCHPSHVGAEYASLKPGPFCGIARVFATLPRSSFPPKSAILSVGAVRGGVLSDEG